MVHHQFKHLLAIKQPPNSKRTFGKYIAAISNNCLDLTRFSDEYHRHYDFINDLFIDFASDGDDGMNSKILEIALNFPSNVKKSIQTIFRPQDFKSVDLRVIDECNCDVFYPNVQLMAYITHIKSNIQQKLNIGVDLTNVCLEATISREDACLVTIITYNGTSQFSTFNKNGGLSQFGNDLARYGGTLDHKARLEYPTYQVHIS